jgi:hypothetical protein
MGMSFHACSRFSVLFGFGIPLIIFCAKEGDIMTLPSNTEEEKTLWIS